MARRAVHLLVYGRVQGVGFRAFVAREAEARGLDGWVRNRRTGEVEAVIAGPDEAMAAMLERVAVGPPSALVTKVEIVGEGGHAGTGFSVRADG